MSKTMIWLVPLLALVLGRPVAAQEATGTLVVQVKPFTSEIELKKKVQAQLESGGLEWGLQDGLMVVTMVNKRFIDFNVNHMTRYGSEETLQLPPGDYRITGIGLEMVTAFSPEKMLDKGAFLNEDVLSFRIEEGKTTTVEINPIIRKDMTFLIKWYVPALMTRVVTEDGAGEEVAINLRSDQSLPWRDYSGPLKFTAK
ncbi:hypothetical protein [Arenimonas aestuarii]